MYIEYLSEADFRLFVESKMTEKYGKCELENTWVDRGDDYITAKFQVTGGGIRGIRQVKAIFTDYHCKIKEDVSINSKVYNEDWAKWVYNAIKYIERNINAEVSSEQYKKDYNKYRLDVRDNSHRLANIEYENSLLK